MATSPSYPTTGNVSWATLTTIDGTAANNHTGVSETAANVPIIFTAGAGGSRIDTVKVRALGTNVATVLRLFINNGSVNTTAANNTLIYEKAFAATTIIETTELVDTEIALGYMLPAGYTIRACLGTAVSGGLQVTAIGVDY